jgi:hypothetical protein
MESTAKTYFLIVSDDPLHVKRLAETVTKNEISKDWRIICFSNDDNLSQYRIKQIFSFMLNHSSDQMVLAIGFQRNFGYRMDILKIIHRYPQLNHVVKVGFFGETSEKEMLEIGLVNGCHLVEYKGLEYCDLITNIQLIKRDDFDSLPTYATSEGYGEVGWGMFVTEIDYINKGQVAFNSKFSKIGPSDEWLKTFMPNLSDVTFTINNSEELDKKSRWLEDINMLNFDYANKELVGSSQLNIKSIIDKGEYTQFVTEKRIAPETEKMAQDTFKTELEKIKSTDVNILIFDMNIEILEAKHAFRKHDIQTYSFPYFVVGTDFDTLVTPQLVVIEYDLFVVVDKNFTEQKMSDEEKISFIQENIVDKLPKDTVYLIFGHGELAVPQFSKYQLNIPFCISDEFLVKMANIYKTKNHSYGVDDEEVIYRQDLIGHKKSLFMTVDIPFIYQQINEHRVSISTPMDLKNYQVIKVTSPRTFYVLILSKLSDKDRYVGLIMGANESDKMAIRQEVYRFMRIPKSKEEESERLAFNMANQTEFIKRQKKAIKKAQEETNDKTFTVKSA